MKNKIKSDTIRETETHIIYEFNLAPHTTQGGKKVVTKQEIFAYLKSLGHKIVLGENGRYKNNYNQRLSYEVSFEKVKKKISTPKKVTKKKSVPPTVVPKVP